MDTSWKLYTQTMAFWDDQLLDIQNAKESVSLEQYIFTVDEVGLKFLNLLKLKAAAGIRVRLLCDASGSAAFFSSEYAQDLKKHGMEIIFYNPISLWRLHNYTSWFFRDHRKIAVIDGQIGYSGSSGIKSEMKNWRDTNVRITGSVVAEIANAFEQMWKAAKQNKKIYSFRKFAPQDLEFRFLTNSAYWRNQYFRKSLIEAIRSAKKYIYLTTPYFVPDLAFFRALLDAGKRKLDVRLILPASSDHRAIDISSDSYIGLALRAGVRVFRYQKSFLHAKTGVIDDSWATVGSANLDNLSLRLSFEGNIVSKNREFAQELQSHFLQDLTYSVEISSEVWANRSRAQKLLEVLSWPVHNFL